MSGHTVSRLFLAVGFIALTVGLATVHVGLAAITGGILLIVYGLVMVDVDRPARRKQQPSNPRDAASLSTVRERRRARKAS